ncbi:MAG: alpha/beta fold hydrolase [Pseudomonadota bacterium]
MKLLTVALLMLCSVSAGCQSTSPSAESALVSMVAGTNTYDSGQTIHYQIGTLRVPENRSNQYSRTIDIQFHHFPASDAANTNAPPIYILKGGPGFAGMARLLARDGHYDYYVAPFRDIADVVVLEHRGFGERNATPCDDLAQVTLDEVATARQRQARLRAGALACRDHYVQRGYDLAGYNVEAMAADVIDVANALGHKRIQLFGNSFGSHWGATIVRQHPERIARVAFTALEGPDHTFDLALEKQAALQRLADAAARHNDNPPVNWLDAFQALIEQSNQRPIDVETTHPHTDAPLRMTLTGEDLREVSQGYSRGTAWRHLFAIWADDMRTMLSGDLSGAARRIAYVRLRSSIDHAAYFSFECASGASPSRRQRLHEQDTNSIIARDDLRDANICADWPADLGETFRQPFSSDVPALLMHGTFDTSTPFANSKSFRSMFTDHHFVRIDGGSHGAWIEAIEHDEHFRTAFFEWFRSGEITSGLPQTLALEAIDWH